MLSGGNAKRDLEGVQLLDKLGILGGKLGLGGPLLGAGGSLGGGSLGSLGGNIGHAAVLTLFPSAVEELAEHGDAGHFANLLTVNGSVFCHGNGQ